MMIAPEEAPKTPSRDENKSATVFEAEAIHVDQDVFLRDGFHAHGRVSFWGGDVGGDFRLRKCTLENPGGIALDLRSTNIGKEFNISEIQNVIGDVDLRQVDARVFSDDHSIANGTARISLDGFTYARLHDCPMRAADWISWLKRQPPEHLDGGFRPQPWAEIMRVLRDMGHDEDAKLIAIERAKILAHRADSGPLRRWWDAFLGFSVGYGYKPTRALWISAIFVVIGWGVFFTADYLGYMSPRDGTVVTELAAHPSEHIPPQYTEFNALVYALDVYLPVIELGQDAAWGPTDVARSDAPTRPPGCSIIGKVQLIAIWLARNGFHRFVYWSEVIFGWIFISLFVAGMSGIMKKD